MSSTTFVDNQTIIYAAWLNDVNGWTYNGTAKSGVINGATTLAIQTAGVDAIDIDASQNVTIGKLTLSGTVSAPAGLTIGGVFTPTNGITFTDGTVQTTASYMGANNCLYENNKTVTANYTVTSGRSAMSVGPITLSAGKTVTLPIGSRWVIL